MNWATKNPVSQERSGSRKTTHKPTKDSIMHQLINIGQVSVGTMTSREIADLVEIRHDNVKRTIEKLVNDGLISHPQIEDGIKSANGVSEKLFIVGKRDSFVIVAQLSPAFTARLVDRWQELETRITTPSFNIPASLSSALRLAADQAETIEAQALQLIAAKPSVEFVEKYVDSSGTKGFRQVCKLLGANESEFREFLKDKKIMYRLGGEWMPHAQHLDTGRFSVKAGQSDLNGHSYNSARFTTKGVSWIAGEFAKHQLEPAESGVAA